MSEAGKRDSMMVQGDKVFEGLGDDEFGVKLGGLSDGETGAGSPEDFEGEDADSVEDSGKKTRKEASPRQKFIDAVVRKAGKEKIPELGQILRGKSGVEVCIKDIGIFTNDCKNDELLSELEKECPVRNRVNLSAEIVSKRVLEVGAQIFEAGRMYQAISVAKIKEDGVFECVSGRHRLVFLALVYGVDAKIPVYVEDMTMNEARDAVVVSNQSRKTSALESAEYSVLRAVSGDLDAAQDDLYYKTVTCKKKMKWYCVFSVILRSYPMKLLFSVSNKSSREGGEMTTVKGMEGFWDAALEWNKETERKGFDAGLKASVKFLNTVLEEMKKQKGFDSKQHFSSRVLKAVGKYYRTYEEITGENALPVAGEVAKCIVKMGEVGGQKSEKTYSALTKALVPKSK